MAVQTTYPGVYIEEFAPGAPISGVGTSTVAFLGPSTSGPINKPTKITSWDAFLQTFGKRPLAGQYLWYAVRGFFENGGTVSYITRVSNARHAELSLVDANGDNTILIWSRESGTASHSINISVTNVNAVLAASLFNAQANVVQGAGSVITVDGPDDAAGFRPTDRVLIDDGTNSEIATVLRIEGADVRLTGSLSGSYGSGTLRLDDPQTGDYTFRVAHTGNADRLASGSVITLAQDSVSETLIVDRVLVEKMSPSLTSYRVTTRSALVHSYDLLSLGGIDAAVTSHEFTMTAENGGEVHDYPELAMDPQHPNYYRSIINDDINGPVYADPVEPPNVASPPDNRPAPVALLPLTNGADDSPATLSASDYKNALKALEVVDDVNMVACPDRTDLEVQLALIAHCEDLYDRFAILDARRSAPIFGTDSVEVHRNSLDTASGFASLYYPWLQVSSESGDGTLYVPPSGHVAGIFARIDNQRGVHKAPAGNEALVNGALGVQTSMTEVDHGQLNLQGINVIRVFKAGGRPVIWGARTTSTDTNWQYVNIRRLFLFMEESIKDGIRWAVFEPNNQQLWQKLKRTITEFLTRVWRDGALFGSTPEEAFYVRIDEALNPVSERALGRLYIEIGVAPSYPAEFIIVRIGIWEGGAEVNE